MLVIILMYYLLLQVEVSSTKTFYLEDACTEKSPNADVVYHVGKPSDRYNSSGFLRASRNRFYGLGRNCSVQLIPKRKLILTIRLIDFRPNGLDYLEVFDGNTRSRFSQSVPETNVNKTFYGRILFLRYSTNSSETPREPRIGFLLTFTGYTDGPCVGRDFYKCGNGFCIYQGLFCDGRNSCGDNSDENESECRTSAGKVILYAALTLVVLVCCSCFLYHKGDAILTGCKTAGRKLRI